MSGKCRKCKKTISSLYFFVELFCAISFVFIFLYFNNYLETIFFQIITIILITIFIIDSKHFIIPDELNFLLIFLFIIHFFLPDKSISFTENIYDFVFGGIIGFCSIWTIIFLYKKFKKIEAMGLGDAKLMTAFGCFFGWQSIPFILFFASIFGLVYAARSIVEKKRNFKNKIPFGPHIILSAIFYFFCGDVIIKFIIT